MENSDEQHQSSVENSGHPEGKAPTYPGGYHSRGVPGEEGEVRRRMRVLKVADHSQRINNSRPMSGGTGADDASAAQLDKALREARWAPIDQLSDQSSSSKVRENDQRCVMEARPASLQPITVSHEGTTRDQALKGCAKKLARLLNDTAQRRGALGAWAWGQVGRGGHRPGPVLSLHRPGDFGAPLPPLRVAAHACNVDGVS